MRDGSDGAADVTGVPTPHVLGAIAAGGALGSLGRFALAEAWPPAVGAVPWSTLAANVLGCLGIGVLLVAVTEGTGAPHPLARPFLGTGVLGGFTTFSTYAVETERLVATGAVGTALTYLFVTLAAALAAAQLGVWSARAAMRFRSRRLAR